MHDILNLVNPSWMLFCVPIHYVAAEFATSNYLNQCWLIVNWTLRNKFQWKLNQKSNIFIQKSALQNAVCEMAAILSRERWVEKIIQNT